MCLYQILERFEPDETEFTVYKVFSNRNRFLIRYEHRIIKETWLKAFRKSVYTDGGYGEGARYETGFHCFFTEEDARRYDDSNPTNKIVKCKARGLEYVGYQTDNTGRFVPCATFTELYIPS